tara:strand:+ start:2879 stop:3334 length:456 start_codon:yes stop_codon:yes gene_type:complete
MRKSVKTPCVGICSTVFGDEVCRGCKRYQHEIIDWNSYDQSEKSFVLNRLESLKVQIMEPKVTVFDAKLLKSKLLEYKVKFDEESNPLCWVFDLLRTGSQSIQNTKDFGFSLSDTDISELASLKKDMEEELFELSEAHYDRYYKVEKYTNV